MSKESLQELSYKVKVLRKDFNKESQPAVKQYLLKRFKALELRLDDMRRNDSGFRMLRTPWARQPQVKYDDCHN